MYDLCHVNPCSRVVWRGEHRARRKQDKIFYRRGGPTAAGLPPYPTWWARVSADAHVD